MLTGGVAGPLSALPLNQNADSHTLLPGGVSAGRSTAVSVFDVAPALTGEAQHIATGVGAYGNACDGKVTT